jgi:hypothetical protein
MCVRYTNTIILFNGVEFGMGLFDGLVSPIRWHVKYGVSKSRPDVYSVVGESEPLC